MGFLGDLYRDLYSRIRERETDEEELNQIRLTDFFSFIFCSSARESEVRQCFLLGFKKKGRKRKRTAILSGEERREKRREKREERERREKRREKSAREKIRSKRRRETTERRLAQQL